MKDKAKTLKTRTKILIPLLILFIIFIVFILVIEISLIKNDYTTASDIKNVIKVNIYSDYEIIKNEENYHGFYDNENHYRNIQQVIMVKQNFKFPDYLNEKGCVKEDQEGALYYYSTAGGKKFTIIDHGGVFLYKLVYLDGVTIDEILSDYENTK